MDNYDRLTHPQASLKLETSRLPGFAWEGEGGREGGTEGRVVAAVFVSGITLGWAG